MKKALLTVCVLGASVLFPTSAMACRYNSEEVERNLAAAVFIGKVKIVKLEHKDEDSFHRPAVTYEVVETEKRAPGFEDTVITIEGGPLTSCDYAGPWKLGAVVDEAFFMENGKMRSETLNMKARYIGK